MPKQANKAAKPATTKAVKPVKAKAVAATEAVVIAAPVKPSHADARAERQALINTALAFVSNLYSGASMPVHTSRTPKLADCIARIQQPRHVAGAGGASDRDHALLLRLASVADAGSLAFDPSSPNVAADIGVLSRLASVGYITTDGTECTITKAGAERVSFLTNRKAKAA